MHLDHPSTALIIAPYPDEAICAFRLMTQTRRQGTRIRVPPTKPITLSGFEQTFSDNESSWRTFSNRDEAHKADGILHAPDPAPLGPVLELSAGSRFNSVALARRALRLNATRAPAPGAGTSPA